MNEIILKTAESYLKGKKDLLLALEYPTWNYITQTFDYTRSYEDGIIFAAKILQELENNKDKFSKKEYESKIWLIYFFVFKNLYKLDQWENYLESWEKVLKNVRVGFIYSKDKLSEEGIEEYILDINETTIHIHFLWNLIDQKEAVKRKLEKKRNGKKIGNLTHQQQSDLTGEEIKERFDWIINYRITGEYNYDPPASKQYEKRKEERKKTINIKIKE